MPTTSAWSRVFLYSRILLGLGLLTFLLVRVDLDEVGSILVSAKMEWLVLALIMPHLGILLSAYKWRYLLAQRNVEVTIGAAFRLYMIGTFFNNFLPSMVGGDVARAYMLGQHKGEHHSIIAATFAERASGLVALLGLVAFGLLNPKLVGSFGLEMLVGIIAFSLVLFVTLLVSRHFAQNLGIQGTSTIFDRIQSLAHKSSESLHEFRPGSLGIALAISIAFYASAIVTVFFAGEALGLAFDPVMLIVGVPVVLLVSLLPISFNGLGLSEAGWIVVFGLWGVSQDAALALGLLLRARVLLTACIGGLMYLAWKQRTDLGNTD